MVNTNIQGPITFDPQGLVIRSDRVYREKEFSLFNDVDIDINGRIVSRPSFETPNLVEASTGTVLTSPAKMLGYRFNQALSVDATGVMVWDANSVTAPVQWITYADTGAVAAPNRFFFCGFHYYNYANHFVSYQWNNGTSTATIVISRSPAANTAALATWASFASTTVITRAGLPISDAGIPLKTFVYKDRLWVVFQDAIYFSKATDFTVFAAPDGGFFNFSESPINDVIAIGDSIYILMDSSVQVLTYTTNPNTDGAVKPVVGAVGADAAVIYGNQVVAIKDDQLYSISYGMINPIRNLVGFGDAARSVGMFAFGSYILIYKYTWSAVLGNGVRGRYKLFYRSVLGTGAFYALNMKTGALALWSLHDNDTDAASVNWGYPCDFLSVPYEDANGRSYMYALTFSLGTGKGSVYYSSLIGVSGFDRTVSHTPVGGLYPALNRLHYLYLQMESITLDGSEYLRKKFRTLLLSIKPPNRRGKISFAYENSAFGTDLDIVNFAGYVNANRRPPYAFRAPMNQRARSFSMRIFTDRQDGTLSGIPSPSDMNIILESLNCYYSYTQGAPDKLVQ